MVRGDKVYSTYVAILKEELVPAMGCTEPIAIAYAAAKAREVLGSMPTCMTLSAARKGERRPKSNSDTAARKSGSKTSGREGRDRKSNACWPEGMRK